MLARLSQHSTTASSHAAEGAPPPSPNRSRDPNASSNTDPDPSPNPKPGPDPNADPHPNQVHRRRRRRGVSHRRTARCARRRRARTPPSSRLAVASSTRSTQTAAARCRGNSSPPTHTQMPQALSPKPRTPDRDPSPLPPRASHPNSAELRDALQRLSVHTTAAGEGGSAADTERMVSAAEAALAWS